MATESERQAEIRTAAGAQGRSPWLTGLRAIGHGLALLPRPFWLAVSAAWMAMIWNLSSPATGKTLWQETIMTSAKGGQKIAFDGNERIEILGRRAVRENIKIALEMLSEADF